ncbi:RagB/SusD family nutrient uptake outer membrane protein [Algoriphagus sp. Y33]|uniref:RagB/SusD family nutrient uptake outer membrane protein n=1 Tax=Algoriphagus sp. Y33 TaxID=2772483 RepID=UPI00177C08BF|nr:RagB/SusD family nutrient uptake outer membrane protein [Algoriphagus sp. Y33]
MKKYLICILLGLYLTGCDRFLDEKPTKAIDTPDSLEALDAMLNNSGVLNRYSALPLLMGGEFYSDDAGINALPPWQQNLYFWQMDPFRIDDQIFDWRDLYNRIQYANVILESLDRIDERGRRWEEIKGTAFFFRANAYFELSGLFLDGPNLNGKNLNIKIPVRKSAKIVLTPELAGKEEILQIIQDDMQEAEKLLPEMADNPLRPGKKAVFALMARVYLDWEEYGLAQKAAEEVIEMGVELLDYRGLDAELRYPFEMFNKEVIWMSEVGAYSFVYSPSSFQVNPELLDLYGETDLRMSLYYRTTPAGYVNFRGSYQGEISLFGGLAVDEVYLIYSECLIRSGELLKAAEVLNELLVNRHQEGFEPVRFTDELQALQILVDERRKELVFRGSRWGDLRRYNADERLKTTLQRSYMGEGYELPPDSERYVLPIPKRELSFY